MPIYLEFPFPIPFLPRRENTGRYVTSRCSSTAPKIGKSQKQATYLQCSMIHFILLFWTLILNEWGKCHARKQRPLPPPPHSPYFQGLNVPRRTVAVPSIRSYVRTGSCYKTVCLPFYPVRRSLLPPSPICSGYERWRGTESSVENGDLFRGFYVTEGLRFVLCAWPASLLHIGCFCRMRQRAVTKAGLYRFCARKKCLPRHYAAALDPS
jgi:hypothetical protein